MHVCLSALTSENLYLESSLLVCRYMLRIFRSSSYIKVIGPRSTSQKNNNNNNKALMTDDDDEKCDDINNNNNDNNEKICIAQT